MTLLRAYVLTGLFWFAISIWHDFRAYRFLARHERDRTKIFIIVLVLVGFITDTFFWPIWVPIRASGILRVRMTATRDGIVYERDEENAP
jgi:hypothetical protein